jgi:hypothetical protein
MTLNSDQREQIRQAILGARQRYTGTDNKFSSSIGISPATFSRLKNHGKTDKMIADDTWITLGIKFGVEFNKPIEEEVVETYAFKYLTTQMDYCKDNSIARLFCDIPDAGKTVAARWFSQNRVNAFYIDCGQSKTYSQFIRALAQAAGMKTTGSIAQIRKSLCYNIRSLERPIFLVDEGGKLSYSAFVEIQDIWNDTKGYCGWYMLGALGLKEKIDKCMARETVGYSEFFRRFGSEYQRITPEDRAGFIEYWMGEAERIVDKVIPGYHFEDFLPRDGKGNPIYSLTRLIENINKLQRRNAA